MCIIIVCTATIRQLAGLLSYYGPDSFQEVIRLFGVREELFDVLGGVCGLILFAAVTQEGRKAMYRMITNGVMAVAIVIGILMLIVPKKMGKKALTETKKGILTVRIYGAAIAVFGLIALILLTRIEF